MSTFSVTDRATFKTCRELWDWTSLSRQGLEGVMPNRALLLGSLIHYTFADWLSCPNPLDPLYRPAVERFREHFDVAELDIYKRYGAKFNSVMEFQEFESSYGEPVRDLGAAMLEQYEDDHHGVGLLDLGMKVVAVEQTVTIPVPKTEHLTPNGWEFHYLEGTCDALLADVNGRLFIVDHKTYERKPSAHDLTYNDQFLAYTWMANQLGFGEVAGVIYNGLWKRQWTDLLDKSGNPRKKSNREPYSREDLYYKTFLPYSKEELDDFGRRLASELLEMGNSPVIYLNRNWYSCPFCSISDLCVAKTRGEDYSQDRDLLVPRTKTPAWRKVAGLTDSQE